LNGRLENNIIMEQQNLKIIFWGTPEFAAIILNSLINSHYKPVDVVAAPDKPIGRKQIITPPPTKEIAIKNHILVLQPEKIKNNLNFFQQVKEFAPDLFIVAAYGLIIPKKILDLAKLGALNVHPSLLPKYRGAAPIQSAILNGDSETGVTIMLMDEQMDHGEIIANCKFKIENLKITTEELTKKTANLGAELLIETVPKWLAGEIKPIPQNESKATFTKIIKKEDGHINWSNTPEYIERQIRAFNVWPGTYTLINDQLSITNYQINSKFQKPKILKIIKASVLKTESKGEPGTVFLTPDKNLAVACGPARRSLGEEGKDALILEKVQLEGKRSMIAREFLNGHPEIIDSVLT